MRKIELHKGTTRAVWLIGNYAFKIPRLHCWRLFLQGLLANMQEVRFTVMAGELPLAPVLAKLPGGFLIVMPRCTVTEQCLDVFVKNLEDLDENSRSCVINIVELKHGSMGEHLGRVLAFDYGS